MQQKEKELEDLEAQEDKKTREKKSKREKIGNGKNSI